jgi:tyrosinase
LYPSEKLSWWDSDEITYEDKNGEKQTLTLTPKTPLDPFHTDKKGTTYDSNGVQHIANLGYTYPELQRWKYPNDSSGEAKYKASIVARIRELYAPPAKLMVTSISTDYIVNVVYER